MKSPHRQRPDHIARADTEAFIEQYARKPGTAPKGAVTRERSDTPSS